MVRHGLITPAQLEEALLRQRFTFRYVGEILVEMGAIKRADLNEMLQLQHTLGRDSHTASA